MLLSSTTMDPPANEVPANRDFFFFFNGGELSPDAPVFFSRRKPIANGRLIDFLPDGVDDFQLTFLQVRNRGSKLSDLDIDHCERLDSTTELSSLPTPVWIVALRLDLVSGVIKQRPEPSDYLKVHPSAWYLVPSQYHFCVLYLSGPSTQNLFTNRDVFVNKCVAWSPDDGVSFPRLKKCFSDILQEIKMPRPWTKDKKIEINLDLMIDTVTDAERALHQERVHFIQFACLPSDLQDKLGIQQAVTTFLTGPFNLWVHLSNTLRKPNTPGNSQSWPFQVMSFIPWSSFPENKPVVSEKDYDHSFLYPMSLQNDSSIFDGCETRFLCEMQLKGSADDRSRLLLHATYIVRLMNKLKKDFIVFAMYVTLNFSATLYVFAQPSGPDESSDKVFYSTEQFDLRSRVSRLELLTCLYNIVERKAHFADPKELESLENCMLKELYYENTAKRKAAEGKYSSNSGRKTKKANAGKEETQPIIIAEGSSGPQGYELSERDTNGNYIALEPTTGRSVFIKMIAQDDIELQIYRFLQSCSAPQLSHFVPVLNTFSVCSTSYLVLPLLTSVRKELEKQDGGVLRGRVVSLCMDLVEGVSFLHANRIAHLDLKPDNFVIDLQTLTLQILDFDMSVWIPKDQDGEDKILAGDFGTYRYRAPETYSSGPYSPFKADRFSSGCCFADFCKLPSTENLAWWLEFSNRLQATDPDERPHLNFAKSADCCPSSPPAS